MGFLLNKVVAKLTKADKNPLQGVLSDFSFLSRFRSDYRYEILQTQPMFLWTTQ